MIEVSDVKPENTTSDETLSVDQILEAQGLLCPEPVMMLHNVIRDMAEGEVVEVVATDPSTLRDIPKFCQFLNHELIKEDIVEKTYHYWIRKRGNAEN